MPERSPAASGPLLLAYDGSEPARNAVGTGAELFPARSAVVVYVWESILQDSLPGHALYTTPITKIPDLTDDLHELLAESAHGQAEEGAELARSEASRLVRKPSSRPPACGGR